MQKSLMHLQPPLSTRLHSKSQQAPCRGAYLPGGRMCLPRGGVCPIACWDTTPLWTGRLLWKHNLLKVRLRAIIIPWKHHCASLTFWTDFLAIISGNFDKSNFMLLLNATNKEILTESKCSMIIIVMWDGMGWRRWVSVWTSWLRHVSDNRTLWLFSNANKASVMSQEGSFYFFWITNNIRG